MEELGEREDVNLTHLVEQFKVKSFSGEMSIQVLCPTFKSDYLFLYYRAVGVPYILYFG